MPHSTNPYEPPKTIEISHSTFIVVIIIDTIFSAYGGFSLASDISHLEVWKNGARIIRGLFLGEY